MRWEAEKKVQDLDKEVFKLRFAGALLRQYVVYDSCLAEDDPDADVDDCDCGLWDALAAWTEACPEER
jgi:hypothetical protein